MLLTMFDNTNYRNAFTLNSIRNGITFENQITDIFIIKID